MPNTQLILAQIQALAAAALPNIQKGDNKEFRCENATEAACMALAQQHEDSGIVGVVEMTKQAILAERAKTNALANALNNLNERLADIEGNDETVTVVVKPKNIKGKPNALAKRR